MNPANLLQSKSQIKLDRLTPKCLPAIRLGYIDGLRGIAALGIVLHHTHLRMIEVAANDSWVAKCPKLLLLAHSLVSLFVVLSGYSLMIPVVRSGDYTLAGGIGAYAFRRARRILPPYYAALIFSLD